MDGRPGPAPASRVRVGICSTDAATRECLVAGLEEHGFAVVLATSGQAAHTCFAADDIGVIVLDLPAVDGPGWVRAFRGTRRLVPVLAVVRSPALAERLTYFSAGADDCMSQPVDVDEVVARVRALARRRGRIPAASGGVRLNATTLSLTTAHGQQHLRPTEFRVLATLLGAGNRVVTREDLVRAAWPENPYASHDTMDHTLAQLRQKLALASSPISIETVCGVGYRVMPHPARAS
jgi:DNA-binding response OmpR family regulator